MGIRGRLALSFDDRPISALRRWLVERAYYTHWCAALGSLPLALVASPLLLLDGVEVGPLALWVYGVPLALAVFGVLVRPHRATVRELEVTVEGLPHAFDGYRVAQLSDTHLGSLTPVEQLLEWVATANACTPDLVALTGDYVTNGTRFHEAAADVFARLRAPDGVIAVLGNHDNFGGCEPLSSALRAGGIRLLMNEHAVIERHGARLVVVGVDDVFSRRADVAKAFSGVEEGAPVLGLAHDPRLFPAMAERGARLVLSGHTHWGQVGVPYASRLMNVARPFFRFPGGLFAHASGAKLWVSPGLGTTGPPVRLGVAPEITVLVLRVTAAAGSGLHDRAE